MLDQETQQELSDRLERIRMLLKSPEWDIWLNFLKRDRVFYLQKKANQAVEEGELVKAQCLMTLLKDCKRQIELFSVGIQRLEAQSKKNAEARR